MKKFLGLILLNILCFNLSIADENKELKLIEDYKNRLFDSAIKEDLKKVEEICTNYRSDKEKNIITDDTNPIRWMCEGSLKPIFMDITYEYNKKLIDKIESSFQDTTYTYPLLLIYKHHDLIRRARSQASKFPSQRVW